MFDDSQLAFPEPNEGDTETQPEVHSVSEINRLIKSQLEGEFPLVWIQGEISNYKPHYSGHWYLSLKDEKSQISAVMFKGFNQKLKFTPEDGMEVLVRGRITVYEPRGSYQLMCEVMEPVGSGALQKAFEQLKQKLAAEGLFAIERKKPIPKFPQRIAIVTSPTGAAIRDMINVLTRRFKCAEVTVLPTPVQGAGAAQEIAKAIALANTVRPPYDVMIVGRGGGSIEDLWAFNEEIVARAIAASKIPVISAVGHEIDFTIADFVADLRAPTPSAAAELVAENAGEVSKMIEKYLRSLANLQRQQIQSFRQRILQLARHLVDPKRRLEEHRTRCEEFLQRLTREMHRRLESHTQDLDLLGVRMKNEIESGLTEKQHELTRLMSMLNTLSPLGVVDRGYAIATKNGSVLKSTKNLRPGDLIDVRLAHGKFNAQVKSLEE